jgi:hypothetical protein
MFRPKPKDPWLLVAAILLGGVSLNIGNSNNGSQPAQVGRICRDGEQVISDAGLGVSNPDVEIAATLAVECPEKLSDCLHVGKPTR